MYFASAPERTIPALKPRAHSRIAVIQSGSRDRVEDVLEEVVDWHVVGLIDGLPYYSTSGTRREFLESIWTVNYKTLIKICDTLLSKPDAYWNDYKYRDFSWVGEAIAERFNVLGYKVGKSKQIYYKADSLNPRKWVYIPVSKDVIKK